MFFTVLVIQKYWWIEQGRCIDKYKDGSQKHIVEKKVCCKNIIQYDPIHIKRTHIKLLPIFL